jgi:uncharacterized membrane protein
MSEFLVTITEMVTAFLDIIAVLIVFYGTLELLVGMVKYAFGDDIGVERRTVWLRYARWLVAALTVQLAADILETSIAPDWNTVGQLGAIAVIRTFLNYFLEKDLSEIRERQKETSVAEGGRGARNA